MCGVFGHLSARVTDAALAQVAIGLKQLAHRGPNGQGLWNDQWCALGHRRLSVIDLTSGGAQPRLSPGGRSALAYNGEIYNYLELKAGMKPAAGEWQSASDTEVLHERLEQFGERAFEGMVGMFAFAWWRPAERELWLVRDRLGEKPMFYTVTPAGDLWFSSELGPLLEVPGVERRTSTARLGEYLQAGYINAPRTPFIGIESLAPGHVLRARVVDGRVEVRVSAYWSLHARTPRVLTHAQWHEEFCATLENAVRVALRSDVPLSALLSGGVDSSVVCLLAAKVASGGLTTVTADQGDRGSEVSYAREVANHIKAHHQVVALQPVTPADVDGLANRYPELNGDASALAALAVCRSVRSQSTVVLTGDGGDELGGGYSRYWDALRHRDMVARTPALARRALAKLGQSLPVWARGAQRLAPFSSTRHPYAAAVSMYPGVATPSVLLGRHTPIDPVHEAMEQFSGASPLLQMMLADAQTYIPGDTLMTLDRAAMSVGLELRAPLLDYRLFELLRDAQDGFVAGPGLTKRAFRSQFAAQLPSAVFTRRKAGFTVPLRQWLGQLPIEELLLSPNARSRSVLNTRAVGSLVRGFRKGINHHEGRLWHLAVLSRWMETWKPSVVEG